MSCLFCRIGAGELPAHVLHRDDHVMAFLDLHPIRPGHVLVIPRQHHVWFEDMPPDTAARVMGCAQSVARALKTTQGVERVAMFFTGIHVPHAHAHLVPMHHVHDVTSAAYMADGPEGYSIPPQPPADDLAAMAARLRAALA